MANRGRAPLYPLAPEPGRRFFGRDDCILLFEEAVAAMASCQVLAFHGPAGIGKTTLLQRLVERCDELEIAHIALPGGAGAITAQTPSLRVVRRTARSTVGSSLAGVVF